MIPAELPVITALPCGVAGNALESCGSRSTPPDPPFLRGGVRAAWTPS